jgi:hypothetical protein
VYVCSVWYPACNTHAPYCHLWPVRLYYIFPQYLNIRQDFRKNKKVTEYKMCVLIFSTAFFWNISHSKKNWARYDQEYISVFTYSTRYSRPILTKLEFLDRLSKNMQISNLMKIRPVWAGLLHADRWTDMTKLIVAFRNFVKTPKKFHFLPTLYSYVLYLSQNKQRRLPYTI